MCKFSQLATPSLLSKNTFYQLQSAMQRRKGKKKHKTFYGALVTPEEINQLG
jgi:hypothetical protein